jgi:hypothetical protein
MLAFSVFSVQAEILLYEYMSVRDHLPANGLRKGKEINNFDPGQRKYKTKKPGRSLDSDDK